MLVRIYDSLRFLAISTLIFSEIWITIGLLLGIVLLIVWRVKKRGRIMLGIALSLLIGCSVLFSVGMYNAYARPEKKQCSLSEKQLLKFGAYVLENQDKEFLPNNGETEIRETGWGETAEKTINTGTDSILCTVSTYQSAEDAKKQFEIWAENAGEAGVLVSTDTYAVLAEPVYTEMYMPASQNSRYRSFNGMATTDIDIYFDNKIVSVSSCNASLFVRSRLYGLIKNERLFDEGYKMFTLPYVGDWAG